MASNLPNTTPRPWRISTNYGAKHHVVKEHGGLICVCDAGDYSHSVEQGEANAELIVRAVNSFDDMLAALKFYRDEAISSHSAEFVHADLAREFERLAEAAIAKAEK